MNVEKVFFQSEGQKISGHKISVDRLKQLEKNRNSVRIEIGFMQY